MHESSSTQAIISLGALLEDLSRNRQDPIAYTNMAAQVLECIEALQSLETLSAPGMSGMRDILLREFLFAAKSAELRSPASVLRLGANTSPQY